MYSPNYLCIIIILLSIAWINASYEKSSSAGSNEKMGHFNQKCQLCEFINREFSKSRNSKNEAYMLVIDLVSQRLDLAEQVALYKWQNNQSIDDPVREAALLASVAAQANASGLSVQFAQQFFQDQINASKIIQFAYFDIWTAEGAPNVTAPDLTTVTRPLINNVTSELVKALVPVQTIRNEKSCPPIVENAIRILMATGKITTNPEAERARALCVGLAHLCQNKKA